MDTGDNGARKARAQMEDEERSQHAVWQAVKAAFEANNLKMPADLHKQDLFRPKPAGSEAPPNGKVPPKTPGKGNRRRRSRAYQGMMSSAAFLASMKPPDYLIDGLLQRGSTYTLTGNTGHCKTLVLLLMAIRVARGDWFCGRKCRQGTVAFYAGENADNVKIQFYAMCADLGIDGRELPILWHEGVFDVHDALDRMRKDLDAHHDLALCIFDSLQAFFMGENDSDNMEILDAAIDFRAVSEGHPNRPATVIAAHPVKNAPRDNLLPRGGSSVTNELDGNLICWLDLESTAVTVHWHGKFRGAPFEPIKLEAVVVWPNGLVNAEGERMPCTVVRQMGERREAEIEATATTRTIQIMQAMRDDPKISQSAIATKLNLKRSTLQRAITQLKERKWVRQMFSKWVFTEAGKQALKVAEEP